jgi:hypothetical protein
VTSRSWRPPIARPRPRTGDRSMGRKEGPTGLAHSSGFRAVSEEHRFLVAIGRPLQPILARVGRIDRSIQEVTSRLDAILCVCHHRLVNGYVESRTERPRRWRWFRLLCEAISPPVLEDSSGMRIRLLIVKKRIRVLSVSPRHLRFPLAPVASDARPGLYRRRSFLSQGSSCLHYRVKGHSSKVAASTVELSGCRLSTLRHHSFPACLEPRVKTANTPITSLASRGNVQKTEYGGSFA